MKIGRLGALVLVGMLLVGAVGLYTVSAATQAVPFSISSGISFEEEIN